MHNAIALLVKMIKHLAYYFMIFALNLTSLICSENTPVVYVHVHIRLDLMMESNTVAPDQTASYGAV